ncbi:sodium/solute symporter [Nibribacter ruber]|uniref:Sodium/solute symporter n=1 Tax=Nibribacter ruber TaxID=2698458 RepID=A0A6P1P2A5_9BACT|nr:sodium/sugar symporter [Nibribacter ruber]QHL88536.1 sodium/solute symporter [Nibribacter ruber]
MGLHTIDYAIFLLYFLIVSGYGYWIYKRKQSKTLDSKEFFLAEGSLTWWAIGASLIASNISAEQFIGMSGSGFAMGLAISSYEWMASATLIVVAIFFIPIYLKNKIYTMPQFLSQRYNNGVATIMAVFWLLVYVFVNLSSILYLGALAIQTITGLDFYYCMYGMAIFAIFITLGGMKVIGYTDVIQVFVLVLGGLATTYLAVDLVSDQLGGSGIFDGLSIIHREATDHFSMVVSEGEMMIPNGQGGTRDAYELLPGLSVIFGSMWIINLSYWGCNQYITQRALGADLNTARNGLLFAAFLKLLMPVIVVLPGIAAYVLFKNGAFQQEMTNAAGHIKPDHAYPVLLELLPIGLRGLSFAALTAAIVASLAGKANSISTIFTLDIYQKFFNKDASEKRLVGMGRIAVLASFIIAVLVAPLLRNLDQAFQYIQEYTGFISPGVFAIFALGFFWKRTTSAAALTAALLTIPLSIFLKFQFEEIPFINRMGIVFGVLAFIMIVMSLLDPRSKDNPKGLEIDASMFKTTTSFAVWSIIICGILAALYTVFW